MKEVQAKLAKEFEFCIKGYCDDLAALSTEQLAHRPNSTTRSGLDFTFEVGVVNRRMAKRFRGETNEAWPYKSWVTAPDDFQTQEQAIAEVQSSGGELLAAWNAMPVERLLEEVEMSDGSMVAMFDLMVHGISHMSYHMAQLNYIQTLHGDGKMHWEM